MKLDSTLPVRPDYGVLDPGPIFKKHFRYPNCDISLRPFCISTDMPMVCNWAWKTHYAADLIASSYQYTSESSFARSYMVMIDDVVPFCEVDICQASQDELCEHFAPGPGDYVLRLLLPTKRISRPVLSGLIQTCLEYFFSVKGVENIYIEGDTDNTRLNQLLLKSGFYFQQKIYQSYRTSNLYCCTRNAIRKKRLL